MKEELTFLWFIKFIRLDLGGRNSGTWLDVNGLSPSYVSNSELEPTYDSEDFT
jgi:hypothetical protein